MTTISKNLVGILFGGTAAQALASAAWKDKVNAVYGFTSAGTGYQVFKPSSQFNSLTQLVPDGAYILDVRQPGFELPGAVVSTAAPAAPAPPALTLASFSHSLSNGYDNVALQVSSPVASDQEYLLVFDAPGAYSYKLGLGSTISLSVPHVTAGQVVTLTAVAPSGARLTHAFTVGESEGSGAPGV